MPLAGPAAAAATAWMTQPAGGRLCADIARVPILAGAIAAGLDVTVMESISVDSPTYDQDVRDFCDDCAVRVKSVQNIFRDWHRALKTGAGTGSVNVAGQVNLLVRAGVAGGETADETEARVKAALEASEKHDEDLSQRKFSLMLHMQQWQSTVAVGTDTDQPNTMLTKVYKAHVGMGGKTLKGSLIAGEFKFRQYMMEVKREAAARGELAFKAAAEEFMAPLDDDCFGNWSLYSAYVDRWIQRYACDGLRVPFDEKLLESVKKEVAAKSFVSTNTNAMRDVEPRHTDSAANAVATLELLARLYPNGGSPLGGGKGGGLHHRAKAGGSSGAAEPVKDGNSPSNPSGYRPSSSSGKRRRREDRPPNGGGGLSINGEEDGQARVSQTDGEARAEADRLQAARPSVRARSRARHTTRDVTSARHPITWRLTARPRSRRLSRR